MEILPAIDLRGGCCVRLRQGDYAQETVFGDNPAEMARRWQAEGATRLDLVDLDGAKAGTLPAVAPDSGPWQIPAWLPGFIELHNINVTARNPAGSCPFRRCLRLHSRAPEHSAKNSRCDFPDRRSSSESGDSRMTRSAPCSGFNLHGRTSWSRVLPMPSSSWSTAILRWGRRLKTPPSCEPGGC